MINMQLAMCQMLANNQQQQQQQQQHSQQQKRTLKRLTNKRERKVTTNDQRRLTTETEELLSPMICHDYHDLEYRPVTSEIMENYLAKRSHRTLTIYHAKVAQKSYGNEKRFFCPPPCIYLSGADWTTTDSTASSFHYQDSLSAKISIHDSNWQNLSIDDYGPMKYGSARTLFISDSDKRKYIHLNIQLLSEDSTPIGMFASRKIKIISKPSKKKQSLKNNECKVKLSFFMRELIEFIFDNSMYSIRNQCNFVQSSSVGIQFEITLKDDVRYLEVKMLARDFCTSMKTNNSMRVHNNGDRFRFIYWIIIMRMMVMMTMIDFRTKKNAFNMVQQ